MVQAPSLGFTRGRSTGEPDTREPEVYCNAPPYLLPDGQTLDANCFGSNPLTYHKHHEKWVPLGWTERDRLGYGRVAELDVAPQLGLYQLQSWVDFQRAGPRVAGWVQTQTPYTYGVCAIRPTLVGYFNGVWNTERDAQDSLKLIQGEFSSTRNGITLEYHLFYNQTGCNASGNKAIGCLMDLAETFSQRQQEFENEFQHRWEYFWDLAAHRDDADTSWLGQLRQRLAANAAAFSVHPSFG